MASARIRLDIDPQTQKRTIVIAYESDVDALPHEHEEAHRALVNKLFEGGIAKQGDAIVVERQTPEAEQAPVEPAAQAARGGVKQGS